MRRGAHSLGLLFLCMCLSAGTCLAGAPEPLDPEGFPVPDAAFFSVFRPPYARDNSLFVSSFSALHSGAVYVLDDIEGYANNGTFSSASPRKIASGFKWPNEIGPVPEGAIPGFSGMYVPDGFLVPLHETGGIFLVDLQQQQQQQGQEGQEVQEDAPIKLTTDKSGYFYHRVVWIDVNGDGRLDALTARAHLPLLGGGSGELLWLEQPASPGQVPWKEHVVSSGPDFFFAVVSCSSTELVVAANEFFGKRVALYTIDRQTGQLAGSPTVVDSTIGPGDDIQVADLDGDGQEDLLVTSHVGGSGGGVFAYVGPHFTERHVLAMNFTVVLSGIHQASPGLAYAVPSSSSSSSSSSAGSTGPASVLVAGDGAAAAYLLEPTGEPWEYTQLEFLRVGGTVGALGLRPGNSTLLFVPWYEKGIVYPYRLE